MYCMYCKVDACIVVKDEIRSIYVINNVISDSVCFLFTTKDQQVEVLEVLVLEDLHISPS